MVKINYYLLMVARNNYYQKICFYDHYIKNKKLNFDNLSFLIFDLQYIYFTAVYER